MILSGQPRDVKDILHTGGEPHPGAADYFGADTYQRVARMRGDLPHRWSGDGGQAPAND